MTLGWIVILQVGVLLLDRFRYGADLTSGAWVAIVVILAAQAYLVLGAHPSTPAAELPTTLLSEPEPLG